MEKENKKLVDIKFLLRIYVYILTPDSNEI